MSKHLKRKTNTLILFIHTDDEKLLEKYKTIWTKIEYFENIQLNALPVYDGKYVKTKIRTYDDNVHANFCGLKVPDDGVECESYTIISIGSLFAYETNITYKYI